MYHANAHVVLHEEPCYRVHHSRDRKVTVQLMDPDKMDVPPGGRLLGWVLEMGSLWGRVCLLQGLQAAGGWELLRWG